MSHEGEGKKKSKATATAAAPAIDGAWEKEGKDVARVLNVDVAKGLSDDQVEEQRKKFGTNGEERKREKLAVLRSPRHSSLLCLHLS